MSLDLFGMHGIAHQSELRQIGSKIEALRDLREAGERKWRDMMAEHSASDLPRAGPSGASSGNGGNSHGSSQQPAHTAPPPPTPPSGPPGTDGAQNNPAPTTVSFLTGAALYDTYSLKRKRAVSDCDEQSADSQNNAINPSQHRERRPTQQSLEPGRWVGHTHSTEDTVRHWNAVYVHADTTDPAGSNVSEPPP